jgi:type III pantothenate kinase
VPQPQRVVVACVSDNALLAQVQIAVYRLWHCEIERVQAQAQALGVTNAYAQPETLGVDRWLVLLAARHDYPLPSCVVDCGTAITVDVLNADGVHQGGLISAGLHLMRNALTTQTAALPFANAAPPLGLATYTEAAIYNGTLTAAVGLIEQVFLQHAPCQLLLTGGDADIIARAMPHAQVDADLVLRGLALWSSEN